MLEAQINLNGPDCQLLFPTPRGRLWRERTFYRDLWKPAQEVSGLDIRPHECRHSYVTHLRAVGVNDADLAEIAGHRVETMLATYTHATRQSFGKVRGAVGRNSGRRSPALLIRSYEIRIRAETARAALSFSGPDLFSASQHVIAGLPGVGSMRLQLRHSIYN